MTKAEITERVATRTGKTRKEVLECFDAIIDEIKEAVADGEDVSLRGFGKFTRKMRAAKVARNITAKTSIHIAAHFAPVFIPSNDFKDFVK